MSDDDDRTITQHFADLVRDWQIHRETVNRAIGLLATELFEIRDTLKRDGDDREARQKELDRILGRITTWQRWRLIIEVVLVLVALAFFVGFRWF